MEAQSSEILKVVHRIERDGESSKYEAASWKLTEDLIGRGFAEANQLSDADVDGMVSEGGDETCDETQARTWARAAIGVPNTSG